PIWNSLRILCTPYSGNIKNACFQAEPQVFLQPYPQVGFALRLVQGVHSAHFGLIVGTGTDRCGTVLGELTIARIAVAQRGELRPYTDLLVVMVWLTTVAAWHLRRHRQVRKAYAALLATLRGHDTEEKTIFA